MGKYLIGWILGVPAFVLVLTAVAIGLIGAMLLYRP